MNKLLIPAILSVTILLAASFALMPVQKATTTHLPSVGTATIADGSITNAKLDASAVQSNKIPLGGISESSDFTAGVVDVAAIGTAAVGADELGAGAVTAAGGELAAAAIPNSQTTTNAALTLTGTAQTVISGTITITRNANLLVLVSIPEVGSITDSDTLTLAIGTVTFSASGAAGTTAPASLAYSNPISTTGTITGIFIVPITGVTASTIVTVPATLLDASATKGTVAINTASISIYALPA